MQVPNNYVQLVLC